MFSDTIECYQAIGDALSNAAKSPWDRIVLDATLDGPRVDAVMGCWRDSYGNDVIYLTVIPRLARIIYELARLLSTEEKGYFKKLSFCSVQ